MQQTNLPARDVARLTEIDAKLAALQAERRQLDARRIAADRAARTKRAVIVGAWLAANEPATFQRVVQALTRPQDRQAFGLAPIAADAASASPTDTV